MPLDDTEFSASFAHRIDSLLESVFNLLYLLETEATLSQKGRQYLTLAEEEVQRVAQNACPELNCSGHFAASCNVLCVDDEPSSLNRRKVILEYKGYLVSAARTATEALAIFRSTDFDLVVTGNLLGRETGTAMAREMKRLKPNVPIIMLSSAADSAEGIETVDAFISKEELPESLLAKLDELAVHVRNGVAHPALPNGAALSQEEMPLSNHPENAQLFAGIVESSDDAIFSKTLEGTITTWNKAAENLYGYRAEEIIGKSASLLQPSNRPGEVHDILQRLRKGEKVDHHETTRVAKDGHMLSVSQTISPIRDAGNRVIGASTIARATTRSAVAQDFPGNDSLRNSEKLAAAGRMVAIVAHEIRNPLEATTDALYLLAESPSLDDSARQFLAIAQDEVAEIKQIATATLDLHRGDAQSPQPVEVPELIDNVLTLYGRKLRNLGIAVDTRYETDLLVNAFSGELRQVFSNIILNAVDALEKTGNKLCVHVSSSFDWANPTRRGLRATISDNGPGIPAQELKQIFEPFYTTKGNKGTGLGLWLCRDIVRKYGGKIRVRSTVKLGHSYTTFCIFLPPATTQEQITSKAA
jgi:PAS domain S-box-containing protein